MKKKYFSLFLLVFVIVVFVCACSQNEQSGESGDMAVSHTDPSIMQADAVNTITPAGEIRLLTDPDGIMFKATAETENGYYELSPRNDGSYNITYIDYQTASRIYLCNRPECQHADASCLSWLSPDECAGGAGLFTDGNKLYVQRMGMGSDEGKPETITDKSPGKILQMELNGDGKKELLSLTGADSIWGAIAGDGQRFYFFLDTLAPTGGEELQAKRNLVALDMQTGQVTPLKEFQMNTYVIGGYQNGVVIKYLEDTTTGLRHTVYTYNISTGELQEIKEWMQDEVLAQVMDNKLYCIDIKKAQATAIQLDNQEESVIAENLPLNDDDDTFRLGIRDGKFMYQQFEHGSRLVDDIHYYSVDLNTGACIENTLKYTAFDITSNVQIIAENSEYFLVGYDKRAKTVQYTGPSGEVYDSMIDELVRGLIKKEKFWNNEPEYIEINNTAIEG